MRRHLDNMLTTSVGGTSDCLVSYQKDYGDVFSIALSIGVFVFNFILADLTTLC